MTAFAVTRSPPAPTSVARRWALALLSAGLGSVITAPTLAAQAVAEIQVAPPQLNISVGEKQPVFATAYDARGNVIPLVKLQWSSANPAVVRVEPDSTAPDLATLIGVAPGVAQVEARTGTKKGTTAVQVRVGSAAPPTAAAAVARPAPVAGGATVLKIEPSSVFLFPAEAHRLNPVFLKDDGSPAPATTLTWSSLLPNVVSVNAEGLAVALSPGQGLIEAVSPDGLAARVPVQVTSARLAIAQGSMSLSPGVVDTLDVVVPDQNGRRVNSGALQWRSTDDAVVRVSPLGVITAVAGGRAEVVAAGFLQEARVPISVHRAVEYLQFSPRIRDTVRIPLGGSQRFAAEPQAADNTPVPDAPVAFRLLDTTVVSFSSATRSVSAKKIGTTRLRVRAPGPGLDTAWTITVIAGGLRLNTDRVGLSVGARSKVSASFTDDAGAVVAAATDVRWTSSHPGVAQVDGDGQITAAGPGRAEVSGVTPWGTADTLIVFVQGEILVTSTRSGTADLFAFDRGSPARITRVAGNATAAAYSPDGTRIAYVTSRDGNQEIYVMDADGSNPQRLTRTPAGEDSPEWTPDGSQIVYASNATKAFQLWIMNADGTNQRRLTDEPAFNFQPAISPDGKSIAYTSTRGGNYDIYVMNIDGSNQRAVTKGNTKETAPAWFKDGQLAYLLEQRVGNAVSVQVTKANLDTGQSVPLTPAGTTVTDFAVSRDGDLLALAVSVPQQGNRTVSKFYLLPLGGGAPAQMLEVPPQSPTDQMFAPSFKR